MGTLMPTLLCMAQLLIPLLFFVARRVLLVMGTQAAFAHDFYSNLNLNKSVKAAKEKKTSFGVKTCKFKLKRMLLLQRSCERELRRRRAVQRGFAHAKRRHCLWIYQGNSKRLSKAKPSTNAVTTHKREVLCPQQQRCPHWVLCAQRSTKDTREQPVAVETPKSHQRFQSTEQLGAKSRNSEETLPGKSKEGFFVPAQTQE